MSRKFMGSISIFVIANDEGYHQSQQQFLSILAKDPPTHHHGLRMDRNRHYLRYHQSQQQFLSILAKDPPTHQHRLRMDGNRRRPPLPDKMFSLITETEMLTNLFYQGQDDIQKPD